MFFIVDFCGSLIQGEPPADGTIVPTAGFGAAGELYPDKPVWYYGLYLALKSQLIWIAAAAAGGGLAPLRRSRGEALVVIWALAYLVTISLIPFGFARYLAPALPALAVLGGIAIATLIRRRHTVVAAGAVGLGARPHWTPDDAGGNLGMRAAVEFMMAHAIQGHVAVADPTLVGFLSDDRLSAVAVEGLSPAPQALRAAGVRAVVVQPSQRRLGNAPLFDRLARAEPRWTISVRGLEMVRIHLIGPDGRPRMPAATAPIRLDVTVR